MRTQADVINRMKNILGDLFVLKESQDNYITITTPMFNGDNTIFFSDDFNIKVTPNIGSTTYWLPLDMLLSIYNIYMGCEKFPPYNFREGITNENKQVCF